MRIAIFTAGSRGDVQPCLVLGKALQQAGFDILFAAPQNFAALVEKSGLSFHPLRGDVQQIMASESGKQFMERGGSNPVRSMQTMRRLLAPVALGMIEDLLEACRGAKALICLGVFAPIGKTIAEIRRIPLINVEPTPLLPTGAFPAPGWPIQKNLGGFLNRLSGGWMLQAIWQWYRAYLNQFRQSQGLNPYFSASFQRILASHPLLGAYSPSVIPPPPDWPKTAHITGYWSQETDPGWQPSPGLASFLEQGDPPVYLGFGSMGGRDPENFATLVLEALKLCGQRGVLLTGWGGLKVANPPQDVFVLESAPHAWLFPRMAAVVHHGGAGTTSEGLRAGVPAVILPFFMDQPFWGRRIHELGLGPEPIPANRLTAVKLANAIQAALDPEVKACAAEMGRKIRLEDGVARAVSLVREALGA